MSCLVIAKLAPGVDNAHNSSAVSSRAQSPMPFAAHGDVPIWRPRRDRGCVVRCASGAVSSSSAERDPGAVRRASTHIGGGPRAQQLNALYGGQIATPPGFLPAGRVADTTPLAVSITDTVPWMGSGSGAGSSRPGK